MAYRFALADTRQQMLTHAPDGSFHSLLQSLSDDRFSNFTLRDHLLHNSVEPLTTARGALIEDHFNFSGTANALNGAALGGFGGFGVTPNVIPVGGDDIPDNNTTTVSLNANEGQTIASSINHPADTDWFVVSLNASETYNFTLNPADTSATGPDFKIVIHDASGAVLAETDSHGMGQGELMKYTADAGGTYYISVEGYLPADIGDYSISAEINNDQNSNGGTPLAAIDWGSMVDHADIKVYYGKQGEVFGSPTDPVLSVGWDDFAKAATKVAFEQYEHIINVHFTEVGNSADADFVLCQTVTAPVLLGQMRPPGEENEGLGDFNQVGVDYDEPSTQQGGFSFITFIHEFGHGVGLAHPHDNGGSSEVMHGVTGDTASGYTLGDYDLNQGVYTTMSYNDGWQTDPDGSPPETSYGYQATLMALDVAVLQQKYGANMSYHTGRDTYTLPSVNGPGTFFSCIWDAGGTDTLKAGGTTSCTIDLRAATLQYEEGGGGWVSWQSGIFGGFTIANDVVIENAKGSKSGDSITGNDIANILMAGSGDDIVLGYGGSDTIKAGHGNDTVNGGDGDDLIFGENNNDMLSGDEGSDTLDGGTGNDTLDGGNGLDMLIGGDGSDTLTGGSGNDVFVFADVGGVAANGKDTITDLSAGDTIDLSGIDADTTAGGDQAFAVVSRFDGHAGELMLKYGGGMTKVLLDTDGDRHTDIVIQLTGDHTGFSDFIL